MTTDGNETDSELSRIRRSIDNIDAALIHILAERFKCTEAIGFLKALHRLAPTDMAREVYQKARLRGMAEDAGLDPDFAEAFLDFLIAHVVSNHEKIAEKVHSDS